MNANPFSGMAARLTFAARLVIGTALVLVATATILLVMATVYDALSLNRELHRQLELETSALAPLLAERAAAGDRGAIRRLVETHAARAQVRRVVWLGESGEPIAAEHPPAAAEAPAWFVAGVGLTEPLASRRLEDGGRGLGRLTVTMSAQSGVERIWRDFLRHLHLLSLAIGLELAGIVLILRSGLRPLDSLIDGARRFGDGDLASRIAPSGGPEMRQTIAAFNGMAEKLSATLGELRRSHEELRIAATAFESEEGMVVADAAQVILRVNGAFSKITGYTAEETVGGTAHVLLSREYDEVFFGKIMRTVEQARYWQGELWFRHRSGRRFPVWQSISAVMAPEGKISHFVFAFSDVSQRKEAEEKIRNLAFFDPLTQLPNRRLLIDRLGHALAAAARHRHHGALLFLDLDHFKVLNDTEGHDIGDQLLAEVGRRLRACVRQVDTVARLGGDEFVIMLENLEDSDEGAARQAKALATKVLGAVSQPIALKGREYHGTLSAGVCLFDGTQQSVDELLKRADVAMYQAKAGGRNRVCFFDPEMQQTLMARAALEAELRRVVAEGQLVLHYQPQLDDRNRIRGAEALLRWAHPLRGLVPPAEFIPVAEESGLIIPIGTWVLEAVCRQLTAWQEDTATRGLTIAVNVSARQFHQPEFVETVRAILARTGANPALLKLELTESVIVEDMADAIEKMKALKSIGIRFSMDDFGTGYSSLSYLRQLPIDQLKIDQSFIQEVDSREGDAEIVRTIIMMAQALGLDVIAEGVEKETQLRFLHRHECFAYQGFLFSQPVPATVFETMIDR